MSPKPGSIYYLDGDANRPVRVVAVNDDGVQYEQISVAGTAQEDSFWSQADIDRGATGDANAHA